jgi:hypothetical protein
MLAALGMLHQQIVELRHKAVTVLRGQLVQADHREPVRALAVTHRALSRSFIVFSARSRLDLLPFLSGMKVLPNFLQPVFTRRQASWLIQSMGQKTQSTEGSTVSMRDTASRSPPS